MDTQTVNAEPEISGLELEHDSRKSPSPREGQLMDRKRRRRLDLKSLPGVLRESARIYRDLAEGRISLLAAEARSRVLRRHSETLAAHVQQESIDAMNQKLTALERQQSASLPMYRPDAGDDDEGGNVGGGARE